MKCFIELDSNNYVNSWSDADYTGNGIEVTLSDETLYGLLDCVKYVNGALELDADKQEELKKANKEELSDIDILKKENAELKKSVTQGQNDISDLQSAVAELYESKQTDDTEVE